LKKMNPNVSMIAVSGAPGKSSCCTDAIRPSEDVHLKTVSAEKLLRTIHDVLSRT
jgi:hypothetical protein